MKTKFPNYWSWFFKGTGGKAGIRRIVNKWIFFHLLIGVVMTILVQLDLQKTASAVLLPLAGIFVGLTFAWAGNAQALLRSDEMDKLSDYHGGGFTEYVFTYQTAILTTLVTLSCWGIAGLGIFDTLLPAHANSRQYFVVKTALFTLSSLSFRECWHAVMGAQWMLLMQREIKKRLDNTESGKK